MNDESLLLQIEQQITGLRNHLRHLYEPHRRVETNTRRAMGHTQEAIRLALKLRRLYASNAGGKVRNPRRRKDSMTEKRETAGVRILDRIVGAVCGFRIRPARTFSNDGPSDHTWIIASCHPVNSWSWVWALYWTRPVRGRPLWKWVLRGCGFHAHTQAATWHNPNKEATR